MSWLSLESSAAAADLRRDSLPLVAVLASRENVAAKIGEAVVDGAANFRSQRQHGAQHLAERRQVVLRDPLRELEQMIAEQRLFVEHGLEIFDLDFCRRLGVDRRDHADQLLVAEGRNHARATLRRLAQADPIGKRVVQRHGQRDFAVRRHGRQDSV
jgi:hypothetical protein